MKKIMVVDDEVIITTHLSRRLETMGYNVVGSAASGAEAVEMARQLHPDIILMDIVMPGDIDGIEASRIIKDRLDIPVVFLTAYSEDIYLNRAKEAEPFGYILKPFQDREVKAAIELSLYKREMERKMRALEEFSRSILDNINEGVITIDQEGLISSWNPGAEKIFQYKRGEALGQSVTLILGEAGWGECQKTISRKQGTIPEICRSHEGVGIRQDGTNFPIHLSLATWRKDGVAFITGVVTDITEKKRMLENLKVSEERLRIFVENMPVMVVAFDSQRRLMVWNKECERITGYHAEEMLSRPEAPARLWPNEERRGEMLAKWTAPDSDYRNWEMTVACADGSSKTLAWSNISRHLTIPGWAVWGTGVDITARKKAEEERLLFEGNIQHTQKLESLGVLAGGIAHDFNNLLTGILGYASLSMNRFNDNLELKGYLENIHSACLRAIELTNQMRAYASRERFLHSPLDLNVVIREISRLLQTTISKKVRLDFQLASEKIEINASVDQMRQILVGLVSNASESFHGDIGVITITTGQMYADEEFLRRAVLGNTLSPGEFVFLEVTDSGHGMDKSVLSRIFDPFFTTKFIGRGLGLSAIHGIVRGYGGAISVTTEEGRGTAFRIILPRAKHADVEQPVAPQHAVKPDANNILVLDDDPAIQDVMSEVLSQIGFQALAAKSGEEGMNIFRSRAENIVGVILDLNIPGTSARDTFDLMKKICPDVPVIVASGWRKEEVVKEFGARHLDGFVHKPYSLSTLKELLGKVIKIPDSIS